MCLLRDPSGKETERERAAPIYCFRSRQSTDDLAVALPGKSHMTPSEVWNPFLLSLICSYEASTFCRSHKFLIRVVPSPPFLLYLLARHVSTRTLLIIVWTHPIRQKNQNLNSLFSSTSLSQGKWSKKKRRCHNQTKLVPRENESNRLTLLMKIHRWRPVFKHTDDVIEMSKPSQLKPFLCHATSQSLNLAKLSTFWIEDPRTNHRPDLFLSCRQSRPNTYLLLAKPLKQPCIR